MFIRIIAVLLLASMPVLASTSPAAACSCAYKDVAQRFERADAAFVGRVISTTEVEYPVLGGHTSTSNRALSHIFEVQSVVRGEFEQHTEVLAPIHVAACGLPAVITSGARAGIFVNVNEDGVYESSFCATAGANELLALAGDSVYPPLPVSNENIRHIDNSEASTNPAPVPAQNPDGTSDPGSNSVYIGARALWAAAIVTILGYALWKIAFTSKRGQQ